MTIESFSKKIFSGEKTTDEEWATYLKDLHRIAPSMTPQAFSSFKMDSGINSYEFLADTLKITNLPVTTIVDLACGDGYLIPFIQRSMSAYSEIYGVDMSEGELEVARKKYSNDKIKFLCESAQKMSIKDESVDAILCHMAFMLMSPAEAVVSELKRLLKPNGIFAAVIGNQSGGKDLFLEIQNAIKSFFAEFYPRMLPPSGGDKRTATLEGLKQLFNKSSGFSNEIEVEDFQLIVRTSPGEIWETWKNTYMISLLPEEMKVLLAGRLKDLGLKRVGSDSLVQYGFPMRRILVRKI